MYLLNKIPAEIRPWKIEMWGRDKIRFYKIGFIFDPTEKVTENIIVDLDEIKRFVHINDDREISLNRSKLVKDGMVRY